MPIERALIVRSPYAGKIVRGIKLWEMRSSKSSIRGRIGIIEAGSGTIIGEVDLVDCLPEIDELTAAERIEEHQVDDISLLKKWKYPWVLKRAIQYDKPMPYHHHKGAVIWVKLT